MALSAQLGLEDSVPIFSEVFLLLPGSFVYLAAIVWRRSWGIVLVPFFPSERGSKGFGGTASK